MTWEIAEFAVVLGLLALDLWAFYRSMSEVEPPRAEMDVWDPGSEE